MPAKCVECGLLQVLHAESREYVAVEPSIRETGRMPIVLVPRMGQMPVYERSFECLAGRPIRAEFDEPTSSNIPWIEHFKEVAGRQRTTCDDVFVQFQPGLSPKEHREMKLLAEVERRNAAWREQDAKWQQQVEALAETRHQELRRDAVADTKANRRTTYTVTAIGVIASVIAAVLAAWLTALFSA